LIGVLPSNQSSQVQRLRFYNGSSTTRTGDFLFDSVFFCFAMRTVLALLCVCVCVWVSVCFVVCVRWVLAAGLCVCVGWCCVSWLLGSGLCVCVRRWAVCMCVSDVLLFVGMLFVFHFV
jgi:hypothetical protein